MKRNTLRASDHIRVKSKFDGETHRFSVLKAALTYDVLVAEVHRVHGLSTSVGVELLLAHDKSAFSAESLRKVLDNAGSHTMITLLVRQVAAAPEASPSAPPSSVRAQQASPFDNTCRPPYVLTPYPWPKREVDVSTFPPVKTDAADDEDFDEEYEDDLELAMPRDLKLRFKRSVTIFVNGQRHDISNVAPTTLLAQYMRTQLGVTGTKIGCGEGGCGACTVLLSRIDAVTGELIHTTTNACMRLLATCDGMAITNARGIGNSQDGFNPLQTMIAAKNGSQCGMCTPGFVTSMFTLLANDSNPTQMDVEAATQGNICRCTGYRPIFDAFREFTVDSQDGEQQSANVDPIIKRIEDLGLDAIRTRPLALRQNGFAFFRPTAIEDVVALSRHFSPLAPVKLVVGNTAIGLVKHFMPQRIDSPRVVIDVSRIAELLQITVEDEGVRFGASVTLSNVIATLSSITDKSPAFDPMIRHLSVVASPQIRNTGSWVGNVFSAKTHPDFPSDVLLLLVTVGAQITLQRPDEDAPAVVSMPEFLAEEFAPGTLVLDVLVPFAGDDVLFDSYKFRGRVNLAHAVLNAGFFVRMSPTDDTVEEARIVYGNLTLGPHFARDTACFLVGKPLDEVTLRGALHILKHETRARIDVPNASREYRQRLAIAAFYKFFLKQQDPDTLDPKVRSAIDDLLDERPISAGTNKLTTPDPDLSPVSEPIEHITASRQASGEVTYTEDEMRTPNMVFAAPVLSSIAKGKILSVDASRALRVPGVLTFLSAKDLEAAGISNDIGSRPGDEELWATSEVHYVGQLIGVVITDWPDSSLGERVAKLVQVEYEEDFDRVFSIADVDAREAEMKAPMKFEQIDNYMLSKGDVEKGFQDSDRVVSGAMTNGIQHHFYMETQSAIAIPEDGDSLRVIAATQGPAPTRQFLASFLGMAENKLVVETRRDGGAYGGKFSASRRNAAAVAAVARILKRPARCTLEREVDFTNQGGRHEFASKYRVGFNTDGKILSVDMDITINAGDASSSAAGAQSFADNAYNIENFRTTGRSVTTNRPVAAIMRAPGQINGVIFMEQVIERVAAETGVDASIVREMNFYRNGDTTPNGVLIENSTLDQVWDMAKEKFRFDDMVDGVEEFNAANRFKKRGVAITPVKYRLSVGGQQGCFITVSPGDATIQVTTSGAESGQGLVTKVAQAVAFGLGVDVATITVMTNSTEKIPNFGTTGGSATSEECVAAALLATDVLNERLAPFREANPTATFRQIVSQAVSTTDLSTSGYYAPTGANRIAYFIWGAAITLAEVDLLTGEQLIIESDIVYDCGQSLNPLVDLGQVEGAFIQGLGMMTLEEVALRPDGSEFTNNTFEYHVPCGKSIPLSFNVKFLNRTPNPVGILGSKAQGEPPLCLAPSIFYAVKNAINAAREQFGDDAPFELDTPLTFEHTQLAAEVPLSALTF